MPYIKSKYYQIKHRLKKILFWLLIDNMIARIVRTPIVSTLVPAATGAYLALREFKGSDWAIFVNFPNVHDLITYSMITGTIAVAVGKSLADTYLFRDQEGYIQALTNFTIMAANVVNTKTQRFKDAASQIDVAKDVFLAITHPNDQINVILSEVKHFLRSSFSIEAEDHLRITILEESAADSGDWVYSFDTQGSWTQTEPNILMNGNSAAKDCLDTGEPRFHPDKNLAAASGHYLISARDGRFGNGSVYCYPVAVRVGGGTCKSIITITTYGNKTLCAGYNERDTKLVSVLLKEICRRLELELTLKSLRKWKTDSNFDLKGAHD